MIFNYEEVCDDFLGDLPKRASDVITRRFGLADGAEKETLQAIGDNMGITRERVRQIENAALSKLKDKRKRHEPIFLFFNNQVKTTGNLRKEDILLKVLGGGKFENQAFFLLYLGDEFSRFLEMRDFYTLWTIDKDSLKSAQKTLKKISEKLNKASRPLPVEDLESASRVNLPTLLAFLEVSKKINKGPQGLWGFSDWPEISPRGVKDKAYIIFKNEERPLHFREVAELIDKADLFDSQKKTHPQTVHNELIKDGRFILVGRGIYALSEWGYRPGTVKDVISAVLKESKKPLTKEEIIEKVSKRRLVAENTILLNLHNKRYFKRNQEGKYKLA